MLITYQTTTEAAELAAQLIQQADDRGEPRSVVRHVFRGFEVPDDFLDDPEEDLIGEPKPAAKKAPAHKAPARKAATK